MRRSPCRKNERRENGKSNQAESYLHRCRAFVDEVPNKNEGVSPLLIAHNVQKLLELCNAAMDVAHDDGTALSEPLCRDRDVRFGLHLVAYPATTPDPDS
jgi:hypothetical protein